MSYKFSMDLSSSNLQKAEASIVLHHTGQMAVVCPYDDFVIIVPPNEMLRSMHPVDLIGDVIASCPQCAVRKQMQSSRWPEGAEL